MSTAIYINQDGIRLLGKNQDVPYDVAYLFTNKSGLIKTSMIIPPDRPMKWVSKYNSITISQVGKEMPNGGMNEVGLVVEQTTLWQSSYPTQENLPAIGELQWIQLMLDTCETIEEVKETAKSVRIVNPYSRLHYMVCDRTGECVIIEFLNGELAMYSARNLPVMANTPYLEAIRNLKETKKELTGYELESMARFKRAVEFLKKPEARIDFVNNILRSVQRVDTAFSIIYDINRLEIIFLSKRFPNPKKLSFQDINFISDVQLAVNIQQGIEVSYDTYSAVLNRNIVKSFFRNPTLALAFGSTISDEIITSMGDFPDSFQSV